MVTILCLANSLKFQQDLFSEQKEIFGDTKDVLNFTIALTLTLTSLVSVQKDN